MSWHEQSTTWRSGAWSLELRDDELAEVRFDGGRVLRSIRAVARDRDWNTPTLAVDGVERAGAALTLAVHTEGYGARLHGTVRAEASGSRLVVSLDLVSDTEYWTNRVGLVVLHRPQTAGRLLRVRHSDGTSETTAFPVAISPHQPVLDIAGLSWSDDGIETDVRFAGDVFEMEDQRNWTDASYKTYNRPLALPFPYRLAAGERVRQRVELLAVADGSRRARGDDTTIVLAVDGTVPDIAVGAATAPTPAQAPPPQPVGSAVLVELDLASANWPAALERAAVAGLPLDVRIVLTDGPDTDAADTDAPDAEAPEGIAMDAQPRDALADAVAALRRHRVARVTAFQPSGDARHVSDEAAIARLRDAMASAGVPVPVVGGARSHFTELNRERHRLPTDLDGIVFSVTPLFHSLRTEQLIESLAMQRLVARQAVAESNGTPVHIGPITLRPHFNDVATTPPPRPVGDDLAEGYGPELLDLTDPRQDSRELAAWTIASAAALAVPGVATLTYFEEWGARGIRTAFGEERPVAAALRMLASLSGAPLQTGDSPDGLVWAVGGEQTVLVANLDSRERTVEVRTTNGWSTVSVPAGGWSVLPSAPGTTAMPGAATDA
jgi:hypothetical protein